MYEDQTYETILSRMLETALATNANLDSREGSVLWLGQAPAAVELTNLYIALDNYLEYTFADTAPRAYLIRRAAERGLEPYEATAAVLELTVTPSTIDLAEGFRFSIGDLNYYISEVYGDGVYAITCETAGEAGNDYSATCVPIEYVSGMETCTVTALLIPGEDEEDTEEFRQRYFDSLNIQAFGGNRADYLENVNAISGVGGVKIYRAWNGGISPSELVPPDGTEDWITALEEAGETDSDILTWLQNLYTMAAGQLLTAGGVVRLVIIDSTWSVPSETLIELVQTTIDPTQNAGEGYGLAPIGHVVIVEAVSAVSIDVACTLTYADGYGWETVEEAAAAAVEAYFEELAESWADSDYLTVRISQIESRLLDVTGITDVADTTLNTSAENLVLDADSIPALNSFSEA